MLKVGVFYDGNYFLHVSNYYNYFHEVRKRLCLPGFHQFLCSLIAQLEGARTSDCRVVSAHYFRGRLSAQEANQRGNQLYNDRVFDDILMSVGVATHYLPLRNRMGRKEEKGIDVWLALEAYEAARDLQLDVLVLVSSDGEYVPLIRKLNALGVKVLLLNWQFDYVDESGRHVSTRTSQDLLQDVTYVIDVHTMIAEGLKNYDPVVEGLFITFDENQDETDDDGYSSDGINQSEHDRQNIIASEEMGEQIYNPLESEDDFNQTREDDQVSSERYQERIMSLNFSKGFGFIRCPPNNLFFYYKDVEDNAFLDMQVGDLVEFSLGIGINGREVAKRVKLLSHNSNGLSF